MIIERGKNKKEEKKKKKNIAMRQERLKRWFINGMSICADSKQINWFVW